MSNPLSRIWARLVGPKNWDREVASLRNTTDDDTPAPGDLPRQPMPRDEKPSSPMSSAPPHAPSRTGDYDSWEGADPGH